MKKNHNTLFNPFPNNKVLDWYKLKASGDSKFIVAKMTTFVFD